MQQPSNENQLCRQFLSEQLEFELTDKAQYLVTRNNGQMAVVGFDNYTGDDIELFIASTGKGWRTPEFVAACFNYVFKQLDCARTTVRVLADNKAALRLVERLGFVREGTLRQAHQGKDIHVLGMLKSECRFIDNG